MAPTAAKLDGPAMIPPPGVLPNFDNPPNLDHIFILTVTLCMTFPAIAVLLRLYTKIYILRKTAFEDCRFPCLCHASSTDAPQMFSFWDG